MTILATHKTLPDTQTQGHPALVISVTPTDNLTSSNVQLALEVLAAQANNNFESSIRIENLATDDILKYSGTYWVNRPKEELTDGGNF